METKTFERIIAAHFLVALLNLRCDYEDLAGSSAGLIPCSTQMKAVREEFPVLSLFLNFPSLLWLIDVYTLFYIGFAAGFIGLFKPSRVISFLMYASFASFTICRGVMLWFPWDCLLCEVLFLIAMFPSNRWPFKLLLFRVMFGFGKHKFLGADLDDINYLQTMSCWQPLATNFGRISALYFPMYFHWIGICFTFAVEVVFPWLFFFKRDCFLQLACYSTVLLMIGIQLLGHFAWFNTLTGVLALFIVGPAKDAPISRLNRIILLVYTFASVIYIIPSQWNSPTVFYESRMPSGSLWRTLSALRIFHSYGVFPPKRLPMLKPVGRFEYQCLFDTENTWWPLEYNYQHSGSTTNSGFVPFSVSPWRFPRFDYVVGFYAASHVFSSVSGLGPLWGTGDEWVTGTSWAILSGDLRGFFVETHICKAGAVRLLVVAVQPSASGWSEVSRHVDRIWNANGSDFRRDFSSYALWLPPSMIGLRTEAQIPLKRSCLGLWHQAHSLIDTGSWRSRSAELGELKREYGLLVKSKNISCSAIPTVDFDHSRSWAGYLSCLTAFHLIPPVLHAGLCKDILEANRLSDEFAHNRIQIPLWVYTFK